MLQSVARTGRGFYLEITSTIALVKLMEHHNYSVQALADKIGVSKSTVAYLRSGARTTTSPKTAKQIEKALGLPIGSLFLRKVSPASSVKRRTYRPPRPTRPVGETAAA